MISSTYYIPHSLYEERKGIETPSAFLDLCTNSSNHVENAKAVRKENQGEKSHKQANVTKQLANANAMARLELLKVAKEAKYVQKIRPCLMICSYVPGSLML